jgi:hypothetical protein
MTMLTTTADLVVITTTLLADLVTITVAATITADHITILAILAARLTTVIVSPDAVASPAQDVFLPSLVFHKPHVFLRLAPSVPPIDREYMDETNDGAEKVMTNMSQFLFYYIQCSDSKELSPRCWKPYMCSWWGGGPCGGL